MRIAVVGAGYVGGVLVGFLREAGHEVVAVSFSGGEGELACDISDRSAVAGLATELGPVDVAVHCAASGRGGDRLERYRSVYLEGCRNIIEALRPGRLVYASSTSVYGQVGGEWVVTKAIMSRSARVLMEGWLRVPPDAF